MSTYDAVYLIANKPPNIKDFHDLQNILNDKINNLTNKTFAEAFRLSGATVTVGTDKVVHVNGYFYLGGKLFLFNDETIDVTDQVATSGDPLVNIYIDVTEQEITYVDDPSIALQMPNTGQYIETSVRHLFNATLAASSNSEPAHSAPSGGATYWIAQVNTNDQTTEYHTHELKFSIPLMSEYVNNLYFSLKDNNGDTILTSTNAISANPTLNKFFTQGILDYGDGAGDRTVMTEPVEPKVPINFRIKKIKFLSGEVDEAELQYLSYEYQRQLSNSAEVEITLAWGFDDVVGSGSGTDFTATNLPDQTQDALAGYYIDINSDTYKIIGNDATANGKTILHLRNNYNQTIDISGITLTSSNPGYIRPAASDYIIKITPVANGTYLKDNIITKRVTATNKDDGLKAIFTLPTMGKYLFSIRTLNLNKTSGWVDMPAGSWTDDGGTSYSYDSPTLIKLPLLPDDASTTVSVSSSKNGVYVQINGWDNAIEYEYGIRPVINGNIDPIDFTNPSANTTISKTRSKNFEITINDPTHIVFSIRPLQAGQVVGTQYDTDLQSGGLAPTLPVNFHVEDIAPINVSIDQTMIDKIASGQQIGQVDKKVTVTLAWNYQSDAGNGEYNATDGGVVFFKDQENIQANELIDQLIYISNLNKSYYIWKNDATADVDGLPTTKIYVRNIDNSDATDAGDILLSSSNPGVIYSDADTYAISAHQVIDNSISPYQSFFAQMTVKTNGYLPNRITMDLPLGEVYHFYLKASKDKRWTDNISLKPGTLTKTYQGMLLQTTDGTIKTYDYTSNLLVRMIDFVGTSYDNGSITTKTTFTGFRLAISGWDFADAFEIGYSSDGYINFNAPGNGQIVISNKRTVDIETVVGGSYYITVRPLYGWQVSGTPANAIVTAGSGGAFPNEQVLLTKDIDIVTYNGSLENVDSSAAPTYKAQLRDLNSNSIVTDPAIKNQILVDANGNDFRITKITSDGTMTLVDASGGGAALASGGASINTDELGRRIYYAQSMNSDYVITRMSFVCNSIELGEHETPGTIRIYQANRAVGADYMTFTAIGNYTQQTDVEVIANYGARDLVIDAFNPDIGTTYPQMTSFSGQLTVYGIPKVIAQKGVI